MYTTFELGWNDPALFSGIFSSQIPVKLSLFLHKKGAKSHNTFVGLVGKVRKKLSPEEGRKGGWRKKAHAARPPGPGLEPRTCRVLGEGPQLHARGAV